MSLFFYKSIAALVILLTSLATLIYPIKTKGRVKHAESFELGEALASGIFLGVAFFHMLPSSIHLFYEYSPQIAFPIAEAICMGGFLLLLFLERLSLTTALFDHKQTIPYVLAIILIIHALTEGMALGIGGSAEALMMFIAIIAHKGSESFALCITLMRHHLSFKRIVLIVACFSLMTPLGIFLGAATDVYTTITGKAMITACFNAFAAGVFLYISTLHHIHFHEHTDKTQGFLEFGCLALGLSIMGIIAFWA
ncbi:MAG TPA: ZIP family metal transporter [Gammaproteobacteria bacterium]|nr:ZIP family metal transporter [Gammaproteobacteria bacterium]